MTYRNEIILVGTIIEIIEKYFSYGEWIYKVKLSVRRTSGVADEIVVVIPIFLLKVEVGQRVRVYGNVRASHRLCVYAERVYVASDLEDYKNEVFLIGNVHKPVCYRTTPFGREITDVVLYTEYREQKKSIIPCIVWGSKARWARYLITGDTVMICGRLQSREYEKKYEDGTAETQITYEVSVSKIEKI